MIYIIIHDHSTKPNRYKEKTSDLVHKPPSIIKEITKEHKTSYPWLKIDDLYSFI